MPPFLPLTRLLGPCLLLALLLGVAAAARDRGADGRFDERRSSHFVLYQDVDIDRTGGARGSVQFEREILAALEGAHDSLDRYLGLRPRRPVQVWLYDPGVFDQTFGGLFRFPAAGFYHGAIRVRGDTVLSHRLTRTLYHEYLHAALDAESPSYTPPAWVNEGSAEWFENRATGKRRLSAGEWNALARAQRAGAWIPLQQLSGPSFASLSGEWAGLAYLESYAAIDYLVRRRGEEGLARFVADLLRLRDPDRALRRLYRFDVAGLDEALREELQ